MRDLHMGRVEVEVQKEWNRMFARGAEAVEVD